MKIPLVTIYLKEINKIIQPNLRKKIRIMFKD